MDPFGRHSPLIMLPTRFRSLLMGCFALLLAVSTAAQNWAAAGLPGHPYPFRQVYADGDNAIYYAGAVDSFEQNKLLRYTGGTWEALGPIDGYIESVIVYHDTLLVGGIFDYQDLELLPAHCVKWWDGNAWQNFGLFPQWSIARKLKVLNGYLYAVGGFAEYGQLETQQGVMRWNGINWEAVGDFQGTITGSLLDIVGYDDTLVVIGNTEFDQGRSIAYLDGNEWRLLGNGILGGLAGPHTLAVYQGDLYVGGQIPITAGNPGQEIMRWNGNSFEGLGLGLQIALNNFTSFCDVRAMVEHDGLLYVGGGCNYAGGVESRGVAIWDGTGWCSVPGDVTSDNSSVYGMDFYRDTLFAATGWIVEGDSVNCAVKFVGSTYIGTCTGPLSVISHEQEEDPIRIIPQGVGLWQVTGLDNGGHIFQLIDSAGRILIQGTVNSTQGLIEAEGLAAGAYVLRLDGRWNCHVSIVR